MIISEKRSINVENIEVMETAGIDEWVGLMKLTLGVLKTGDKYHGGRKGVYYEIFNEALTDDEKALILRIAEEINGEF